MKHKVQYYETDMMGVTHHANYIHWMEEARIEFMDRIGFPYKRMEEEGVLCVVKSLQVNYLKPCTFGDEVDVRVGVKEFNGVVITMAYDMRVDGEPVTRFVSDGLVIATPTGSTGYSLSAGGPIVEPGMNCIVITPVCPHSMMHCPCIVPGDADIRLLLHPEREQSAELQIDGRSMGSLSAGDEIHVTGTEKTFSLVRLHQYDFFGLVRRKLSEWGSSDDRSGRG